jgi:NADH-quinone oxidoreductase subunit L
MDFSNLLWLIPLLPLSGAVVNGVFGRRFGRNLIAGVACGTVALAFAVSLGAFLQMVGAPEDELPIVRTYFTWIEAGQFQADAGFLLDQLSGLMILIVTGVGLLIHIYSAGYMAAEDGFYRYFAYLNLFMFSMLTLVLADNYLLMFVGWEGVGLCSYLLIGFYFERRSATDAGKKAFIVNRVGDFGFILALSLVFWTFGSIDYETVFSRAAATPAEPLGAVGAVTAACLLMLLGATGKSAQIPLYVWLPDAMEGPTPVSALIHAATMVTAGVYVVARSAALFNLAPTAMLIVALVGTVTALFAASIGLVQTDIKRVLAYSTVSQLGYMFLAVGVGAYAAGIFHLMTHAFFKALLFLGAGSVIHGMGGIQDLTKMGGLRKKMPWTFLTFVIGSLALAGLPGLAGFFSKDAILWGAFSSEPLGPFLWGTGVLAAGFTAFYTFRLVIMAFFGSPRYTPADVHHVHESPATMRVPLIILAVCSIGAGYLGVPSVLGGGNHIEHFLEPVVGAGVEEGEHAVELAVMGASVAAGLLGLLLACLAYGSIPGIPVRIANAVPGAYSLLSRKYYVDEIYDAVIVWPVFRAARDYLWGLIDSGIIEGAVNGVGRGVRGVAGSLRHMQSGSVRAYAAWILAGGVVVMAWLLR